MALTIKDGAGSTTSLKTTLTGSDHMPHHIIQAVSGTVAVTSSAASPVYITGSVSVIQPIIVDITASDYITASIANAHFNDAIIGISHSYWNNGAASNALAVKYPSGYLSSSGPYTAQYVNLLDSEVSIVNPNFNAVLVNLLSASNAGNHEILVITTGSSAVSINNSAADAAFNALSYSFGDNSIKVKLTGSNTVKEGPYDILLVRGTGSQTEITNTGFGTLVNYLTAATDLGNSDYRLKVNVLNTASVNISNTGADTAFTALSSSFADNSLKVKLTGSNTVKEGIYDILLVRGTGSQTEITNTGFGQLVNYLTAAINTGDNTYKLLVKTTGSSAVTVDNTGFQQAVNYITSAYNSGDNVGKFNVHLTGNSNVTIDNSGFQTAINNLTASTWNDGPLYAIKVKITGSSTTEVTNTSATAIHVTSSSGLLVKEKSVKSSTVNSFRYPGQYDWTTASGTFVLATEDDNRKGLIISNPSQDKLYIVVGSGSNNGFTLTSTGSDPQVFSFIVYPSGTYTADPVMAAAFHAGFFISQSNFTEIPYAMSTKITY